jgi:hypothetical protein
MIPINTLVKKTQSRQDEIKNKKWVKEEYKIIIAGSNW